MLKQVQHDNHNMLDINFIRDNLKLVKKAAVNKNREVDFERLLELDEKRRNLIQKIETLRKERNIVSASPSPSLSLSDDETNNKRARGKSIKEDLKKWEEELRLVEKEFNELMLTVPNVPHKDVPIGKDASGNVEVKKWGEPKIFSAKGGPASGWDYQPKDHIELAKKHDLIDFERGVKVGGFRTYFLKNEAAQMELALMFYTYQKLIGKGYTPLIAPSLVKEFTLIGNGQFPWGKEEVYHIEKDDIYLAGTAEVPVTAYFADEILDEKSLPQKFVAFSPCFRREAGSYGKDTKGIYRLHQFNKIEQVIISTNDEENSLQLHEELLANAEEVIQDLKLPYRVLLMCTGDMGEPQVKKYDIETWMPSRNAYGETMSNSFMGDFQTRRLKVRYRTKSGEMKYCHSLNNTAIASPRILIAILENYQNADGSITVPDVLRPFLNKDIITG